MKTYKTTRQLKALIPGGYRKREFFLCITDRPINTASYWDGGSKSEYIVRDMTSGRVFTPPAGRYPDFVAEYALKPGEMLISFGIFRGKLAYASITCLEEDFARVQQFLGVAQ
jgi:hypothetical protein